MTIYSCIVVEESIGEEKESLVKINFQNKKDRDTYYKLHYDKMQIHKASEDSNTHKIHIRCGNFCGVNCESIYKIIKLAKSQKFKDEIRMPNLEHIQPFKHLTRETD